MSDFNVYLEETAGALTTGSLTMSKSVMMLGPPRRFSRILISRLIFFFFTGCVAKETKQQIQIKGTSLAYPFDDPG